MPQIIWVISTCLQKNKETSPTPTTFTSYEERLKDYINGIPSILKHVLSDEKVFITENTGNNSSFLDNYGIYVHYTNSQQTMFHENQGKKEFTDIISCLNAKNIDDDDMVIKVTGRYIIETDFFPELVRRNVDKDVVYCPKNAFKDVPPHPFPDCILGMIAMKAKHWRNLPLELIPDNKTPTEWFIADYIVKNTHTRNRVECDKLDLSVKIGSSKSYWTV